MPPRECLVISLVLYDIIAMTDGADYPGYYEPEPETESTSNLIAAGFAVMGRISYLILLMVVSLKVVISGTVGALLALNLSQTIPEGLSTGGTLLLVLLFAVFFAIYHHMERDIKNTEFPE